MTQKEKINVAELLKDCPRGMELDCTMYDNVTFERFDVEQNRCYFKAGPADTFWTTCHGKINGSPFGKCVIFPKGKTTWEGFVPPCKFKDGDIVYVKTINHHEYILIFKEIKNHHIHKYVCFTYHRLSIDKCPVCLLAAAEIIRLATEEEKKKLFDSLKEQGYKWNANTNTLEKLVKPKFKVGDRIRLKDSTINFISTVTKINEDGSIAVNDCSFAIKYELQDDWELVPDKFAITTLKPFDKVLVRDNNTQKWTADLFSFYDRSLVYPYSCVGHYTNQCIPFESNKHLLGTTDDCDEYFKNWE